MIDAIATASAIFAIMFALFAVFNCSRAVSAAARAAEAASHAASLAERAMSVCCNGVPPNEMVQEVGFAMLQGRVISAGPSSGGRSSIRANELGGLAAEGVRASPGPGQDFTFVYRAAGSSLNVGTIATLARLNGRPGATSLPLLQTVNEREPRDPPGLFSIAVVYEPAVPRDVVKLLSDCFRNPESLAPYHKCMTERRKAPRSKVLKGARVLILDQFGRTLECAVRDLSPVGARLALRVPRGLPSKFQLMFEADGSVRQCRAIWRSETHVGLAFLSGLQQQRSAV
jgi:hypothetical protein